METAVKLSGSGGHTPPIFPVSAGGNNEDDGGNVRYHFVFIDGKFTAIQTKN